MLKVGPRARSRRSGGGLGKRREPAEQDGRQSRNFSSAVAFASLQPPCSAGSFHSPIRPVYVAKACSALHRKRYSWLIGAGDPTVAFATL
jgi:hypothetical protein